MTKTTRKIFTEVGAMLSKIKVTLEQVTKFQRWRRGIALLFL